MTSSNAQLSRRLVLLFFAFLLGNTTQGQVIVTEGTNLAVDVSPADGRLALDLLGGIWLLEKRGGEAIALQNIAVPARRPRWSPGSDSILYEVTGPGGNDLWIYDISSAESRPLGTGGAVQSSAWHPDGERVVYSAPGNNGSFELWELDVPTGLRWRITQTETDEVDPAWSGNGRHLAWIARSDDGWALMLRRRGSEAVAVVQSESPLHAPSWRPDNSLITFLRSSDDGLVLSMAILSEPPVIRDYSDVEADFFVAPVSWQDRQQMVYAADGKILQRQFGDRRARPVHFRASLAAELPARRDSEVARRDLPVRQAPSERLVIRAARIFDGYGRGYTDGVDVVLENGRIVEVAARKNQGDALVLDMGGATVLPGLIDVYSSAPSGSNIQAGSGVLSFGVTTLVSDESGARPEWHGEQFPGPRIVGAATLSSETPQQPDRLFLATLPSGTALADQPQQWVRNWQTAGIPVLAEDWTVGLGLGVDLLLGADVLPQSPGGQQYQDMRVAAGGGPLTLVSGLASRATPGVERLLKSRQARALGHDRAYGRRLAISPVLDSRAASIVAGSKPSGLPAGLALHAELLALQAAGLEGHQVLKAAGRNAARVLGIEGQAGLIAPGALADLVLVRGDPLSNVADATNIVAVIRNGRFFSLVSLLERAGAAANVGYFDKPGSLLPPAVTN